MFYIFSTGSITIPANSSVDLSNEMYSNNPIELDRLTLYFNAPSAVRENVFVNFKPFQNVKWEFHQDLVPIDYIYSTPQFPYILKEKIRLHKNNLQIKLVNNNAVAVTLCIAFFGSILVPSSLIYDIDRTKKRDYNYQITDPVIGSAVTVSKYGVVTLPVSVPPTPFTGSAYFLNNYEKYFEITDLTGWLSSFYETLFTMQLETYSIPLVNRATYLSQVFGTPDQPFKLNEIIPMAYNEKLIINFQHSQIAPVAPFPVGLNFHGNLYRLKEEN